MSALTEQILRERTVRAFAKAKPEDWGDVIEQVVAVVVCDRCGRQVDLLAEPLPRGWTTSGSHDEGWTDLCTACSS